MHHLEAGVFQEQHWNRLPTKCQPGGNILKRWSIILQHTAYAVNQSPLYRAVLLKGDVRKSENQEVQARMASLSITPNDPLGDTV